MNKFTNPLDNIKIASPCSQDWDAMIGGERKRFCGECKLNVYNLSAMSKTDAEKLLFESEGRLCVRFYRRADGTILTKDCPVGWAAIKHRLSKTATAFASLMFGLLASLGFASMFNQPRETIVGSLEKYPTATPTPKPKSTPKDYPIMGAVAAPARTPTPKPTPKKSDTAETGDVILLGKPMLPKN